MERLAAIYGAEIPESAKNTTLLPGLTSNVYVG